MGMAALSIFIRVIYKKEWTIYYNKNDQSVFAILTNHQDMIDYIKKRIESANYKSESI